MKLHLIEQDHQVFLKKINWQLLIVLLLMVACFFTWSENIVITRAIKLVGRLSMLFASWYIYRSIIRFGAADNLRSNNFLSPLFYGI